MRYCKAAGARDRIIPFGMPQLVRIARRRGACDGPSSVGHPWRECVTQTRDLLALRIKSLWSFFAGEGFLYWAMCFYLVVEYVRPQQLLSVINDWPLGQIVLGAALVARVGSGRWFAMKGVGSWLLLLFTAVIVVSSLTAYDSSVAYANWRMWLSWVVIYFLIINVVNTEQRFVLFLLVWMICNYYMSQGGVRQFALRGFRFSRWGVKGAPGWFENSGEFGIEMCIFLVISWHFYIAARPYLNKWWKVFVLGMPVSAVLSIIGSSSRSSLLGLAALGIWAITRTKHGWRTTVGVIAAAAVIWLIVPAEFKDRLRSAGQDDTSQQRLVYWRAGLDIARNYPMLGVGFFNWEAYYSSHYADPTAKKYTLAGRIQVPHNIFIQAVAELGYAGLLVFALLIAATLRLNYQTRKYARSVRAPPNDFVYLMGYALDGAMISYLVCGFFVTVLYYPFFWINLALTVALHSIARQKYRAVQAPPKNGVNAAVLRRAPAAQTP